jgi:hypothetical protein
MIKNSSGQKGSVHVVLIVILILAIVGTLGFILWSNFLTPKTSIQQQITDKTREDNSTDIRAASASIKPQDGDKSIHFTLPDGWTIDGSSLKKADYQIDFIAVKYSGENDFDLMASYTNEDDSRVIEKVKTSKGDDVYIVEYQGYVVLSSKEQPIKNSYPLFDGKPLFVILYKRGGQDRAALDLTLSPANEAIENLKSIVGSSDL